MFLQTEYNTETMQITLKRKESKTITFKEGFQSEDFMIQQRINREEYEKYIFEEFESFLNSFKFQNWFSTLNKTEREQVSKMILTSKNNIYNYIQFYKDLKNKKCKSNTLKQKNKIFINKYIYLIAIIDNLPFISDKIKDETSRILFYHEIENKK